MASNRPQAAAGEADVTALADVFELVVKAALAPLVAKLKALEGANAELGALRVQLAAMEARQVIVPGPQGPPGADGLGFADYTVEYDGERRVTHRWARGDAHVETVLTMPNLIYRGVHVAGKVYDRGDCVTAGGSLWHCNVETSTRPGDGAPAWTLAVKRGRDASGKP